MKKIKTVARILSLILILLLSASFTSKEEFMIATEGTFQVPYKTKSSLIGRNMVKKYCLPTVTLILDGESCTLNYTMTTTKMAGLSILENDNWLEGTSFTNEETQEIIYSINVKKETLLSPVQLKTKIPKMGMTVKYKIILDFSTATIIEEECETNTGEEDK